MRLTQLAPACGCAAKLSPQMLDAVLPLLRPRRDPNLMVGYDGAEDAAVYRLGPDAALVMTVDFFTPIVDEPEDFGAIAAANALSDVYAMGGRPLVALSVLGFPADQPADLLRRILEGGLAKLEEAGCCLGGGHSVRDPELKFGYSVTGMVHPDRVLRNAGARPGDRLVLTKPIGTGVITTALKRGAASAQSFEAALNSMRALNRAASEAATAAGAHAATDVTGFGLLGHAREMALASRVRLRLQAGAVPWLPGARDYALDFQSQGLLNNRAFVSSQVGFADHVPEWQRALLFDPQTSGGLLLAAPPAALGNLPGVEIGVAEPLPAGEPCLWVE